MGQTTKLILMGTIVGFAVCSIILIELYRDRQIDRVETLTMFAMLVSAAIMAALLWSSRFGLSQ
jgi:hypothetical protein